MSPEREDKQFLPQVDSGISNFLKTRSRIFGMARKARSKYIKPLIKSPPPKTALEYELRRPLKFATEGPLPREELLKIRMNFKKSLVEGSELAEEKGKIVIMSSVPTNLSYKPLVSLHRPDLTDQACRKHLSVQSTSLVSRNLKRPLLVFLKPSRSMTRSQF